MATQVEVINLALGHIAQAPITSISEASVQAEAAVRIWDTARKEALRGHDWAFATVVATLTPSATFATLCASGTYAGNWQYAYTYPGNCLALWKVYNEAKTDKTVSEDFRELYDSTNAQKVIVTNTPTALGEYTFDVTDPAHFDSNFTMVLSYRLAAGLAMQLTGDPQLGMTMTGLFEKMLHEAKRGSSLENNPDHIQERTSCFEDAR